MLGLVSFLKKAERVPAIRFECIFCVAVAVAETLGDKDNEDERKIRCSMGGAIVELDAWTRIILRLFGTS